jgi:hypothetical protein
MRCLATHSCRLLLEAEEIDLPPPTERVHRQDPSRKPPEFCRAFTRRSHALSRAQKSPIGPAAHHPG